MTGRKGECVDTWAPPRLFSFWLASNDGVALDFSLDPFTNEGSGDELATGAWLWHDTLSARAYGSRGFSPATGETIPSGLPLVQGQGELRKYNLAVDAHRADVDDQSYGDYVARIVLTVADRPDVH